MCVKTTVGSQIASNFEMMTADNLPGPDTGLPFTFVDFEGEISAVATSVRPYGFEPGYENQPDLVWLDSKGQASRMPVSALRGVILLGTGTNPMQPEIAFRYYKQNVGMEIVQRVLRLTGVAYGTHEGHMGDMNAGILPEKPTWYMVGDQIGIRDFTTGDITEQAPASRVFPFTRIVNGPVGDPTDKTYRQLHGIY